MPRNRVTRLYGVARSSPSERKAPGNHKIPMRKPQGVSKITNYVDENKEWRDSTRELVQEFQAEECDHSKTRIVIAQSPSKKLLKCPDCGDIKEEAVKHS